MEEDFFSNFEEEKKGEEIINPLDSEIAVLDDSKSVKNQSSLVENTTSLANVDTNWRRNSHCSNRESHNWGPRRGSRDRGREPNEYFRQNSETGKTPTIADVDTNWRQSTQNNSGESYNWNAKTENRDRERQTNDNFRQNYVTRNLQGFVANAWTDVGGRNIIRGRNRKTDVETREVLPLGLRQLEELLLREPGDVILSLAGPRSGLKECLAAQTIDVEVLSLLIKALRRAFSTELHPANQNFMLGILTSSTLFNSHITQLLFNRRLKDPMAVLSDLSAVFETIIAKMPDTSVETLDSCVKQCAMLAINQGGGEVSDNLEKIKTKIETLQETKDQKLRENRKVKVENYDHFDEPPEDFREIVITPSIEEIRYPTKPFLRKNIIEGQFNNVDHYLDIHFRLLREDFIAPLRNGITDYLNRDVNSDTKKIRDIRLYENVFMLKPHYTKDGLLYKIQFDVRKFQKVNWDNSRLLIFGSLVCLSSDNFQTAIFGTVAERDVDDLKLGVLKIKIENELQQRGLKKLLDGKSHVMAESQAYFEAYRHVLNALQRFNDDNLPLQDYIVYVDQQMNPPFYLRHETVYKFTTIVDKQISSLDTQYELYCRLSGQRQLCTTKRRVGDIHDWPSAQELNLDDSQRRAMHLALSSAVAVIQGPPGTGKTHVGLKIMKTLLLNQSVWETKEDSSPILVVCLTNHALDQFLEKLLPFTKSLVRVGGRSTNKSLEEYNLRYILHSDKDRWQYFPRCDYRDFYNNLSLLRGKIEFEKNCLDGLKKSIFHETSLNHLTGEDRRLVKSLSSGFEERFEFNPVNELCCPSSFLVVWLGLTYHTDFVSDFEVEDFYYQDRTDIQAPRQQRQQPWSSASEFSNFSNDLVVEDEDYDDDDDDDLIDVEDQWTAMNRHRQTEYDEIGEIRPFEVPEKHWVLDVYCLSNPQYFSEGMEVDETWANLLGEMGTIRQKIAERELSNRDEMGNEEITEVRNVWFMSLTDRWRLYRRWVGKLRVSSEEKIEIYRNEYDQVARRFKEALLSEELNILRNKAVIGMTTTGAAKNLSLLNTLGPKIVIVEEAAEVLESHIITSLSSKTQHLILIGDHQQLRPTLTVYELAEKYHLDVSLFERLIKNDVPYETLQLQHRMRPEISRLLVPNIYKNLEDHPSVRRHPAIKGVKSSVFFLTHTQPEEVVSDSTTRSNPFEAEFLVGLCRYLLQQGYKPSQITILTTYAGQLFALRRLMKRDDVFEEVNVTVVDNFQGEESDIILLSFVRSNDDGNIGFLKIDNRVNVALSRAKIGLFCVGNFKFLASRSKLWRAIVSDLETENQIGDTMTLICHKHNHESFVNCKNDFQKFSPDGGCFRPCLEEFSCGHICDRLCHGVSHADEQGCTVIVERELPDCKHIVEMPCYRNPDEITYCPSPCDAHLPKCGHKCPQTCHPFDDPNHEYTECRRRCTKTICDRGHRCENLCSDEVCSTCRILVDKELPCGHFIQHPCSKTIMSNSINLRNPVTLCKELCKLFLRCGHQCRNTCSSPCGPCKEILEKTLPCGHTKLTHCSNEIHFLRCSSLCVKLLPCGHQCSNTCGVLCTTICKHPINRLGHCGHEVQIPCYLSDASPQEVSKHCTYPCKQVLKCQHICRGTCGTCRQGRVHVPCTQKCQRRQICGHTCTFPCSFVCPPCNQTYATQCSHSRRNVKCGQVYKKCREKCQWSCEHLECTQECGNFCNRERCNVPCKKQLPCGHQCIGLCGEICPKLCRICNIKDLTEFTIYGNEDEQDSRFIQLQDCGHCIEVEALDHWMDLEDEEIGMKGCPRCKTTIWRSYRYGNAIKRRLIDVQKVQAKVVAESKFLRRDRIRIYETIKNDLLLSNNFRTGFTILQTLLTGNKVLYQNQLMVIKNQVKILKLMTTMLNKSNTSIKSKNAKEYFKQEIEWLSNRLMKNKEKINEWELEDIVKESKRVELWTKYKDIEETHKFDDNLELSKHLADVNILLTSSLTLTTDEEKTIEDLLKNYSDIPELGITEDDQFQIVNTIKLSPGHWHKCPNGHIYAKIESGEDMHPNLCNECSEIIE